MNGTSARSGFSELPFGRSEVFTELEFPQVQFPPHAPVAREAVEGMAKRRRPIAFEPEVADPGEAVTADQCSEQEPELPRAEERDDTEESAPRPDVVKRPRHRVPMLREIEGVELAEAAKTRVLG